MPDLKRENGIMTLFGGTRAGVSVLFLRKTFEEREDNTDF